MTAWIVAAVTAIVALACYKFGRSRYGAMRLSELPVLPSILLAGPAHRARLHAVLVRRQRRIDPIRLRAMERECEVVPPSALEERMEALSRAFRATSVSVSELRAPRRERMCAKCDEQWHHARR